MYKKQILQLLQEIVTYYTRGRTNPISSMYNNSKWLHIAFLVAGPNAIVAGSNAIFH